jgi:hypothetical protein
MEMYQRPQKEVLLDQLPTPRLRHHRGDLRGLIVDRKGEQQMINRPLLSDKLIRYSILVLPCSLMKMLLFTTFLLDMLGNKV